MCSLVWNVVTDFCMFSSSALEVVFEENMDLNKNPFWFLNLVLLCPPCQHLLLFLYSSVLRLTSCSICTSQKQSFENKTSRNTLSKGNVHFTLYLLLNSYSFWTYRTCFCMYVVLLFAWLLWIYLFIPLTSLWTPKGKDCVLFFFVSPVMPAVLFYT